MHAEVGDEVVVDRSRVGAPPRKGEVLEVLEPKGEVHYLVRWDDGRETIFFPGSDAHTVHPRH